MEKPDYLVEECPFGSDTDVLVVCNNPEQRRQVQRAFGLKARYILWGNCLAGYRFKKIIVFPPPQESYDRFSESYNNFLNINLMTRLSQDGELIKV